MTTTQRLAWPARYVHTGKALRRSPEGSDLWLVLEQLKHGPLTTHDVAELLDVDRSRALKSIQSWIRCGYLAREPREPRPAKRHGPKRRPPQDVGPDRLRAVYAWCDDHGKITADEMAQLTGVPRKTCASWASRMNVRGKLRRVAEYTWTRPD